MARKKRFAQVGNTIYVLGHKRSRPKIFQPGASKKVLKSLGKATVGGGLALKEILPSKNKFALAKIRGKPTGRKSIYEKSLLGFLKKKKTKDKKEF